MADRSGYEHLLSEISDRVITGYQTNRVLLSVVHEPEGTAVNLAFSVAPWAQTVQLVDVDIQFSGVSPFASAILQEKIPALKEQLQETLQGASLDAADWAGGILRGQVKSCVEKALPDFKAAVDLTTKDGSALVQVVIYPVGELVRSVEYSMISRSIPNILLMQLKYKYADKAKSLQGSAGFLPENKSRNTGRTTVAGTVGRTAGQTPSSETAGNHTSRAGNPGGIIIGIR